MSRGRGRRAAGHGKLRRSAASRFLPPACCLLSSLGRRSKFMLIIGELINCTRKKVGAAAAARDGEFFKEIAQRQVHAGADMLDVNGGLPGQEREVLPWLVNIVQEAVSAPLCLDSADPEALRIALP